MWADSVCVEGTYTCFMKTSQMSNYSFKCCASMIVGLSINTPRGCDLLDCSPLLVWLELVVVALRVERSLDARAERSRGSTGISSTSGEVPGASHVQPSARAADHTANTNVNIMCLSRHASCPSPTRSTNTLRGTHLFVFTLSCSLQSRVNIVEQ